MTSKIVAVISLVGALGCGSSASPEHGLAANDAAAEGSSAHDSGQLDGGDPGDAGGGEAGEAVLCCVIDGGAAVNCSSSNPFKCYDAVSGWFLCNVSCDVGTPCSPDEQHEGKVSWCNK